MPVPEEAPKGRRLRTCDAVAVPVYQVDNDLLSAVFAPPHREDTRAPLSAEQLQRLEAGRGDPQLVAPCSCCDGSALSKSAGLTPEELAVIRSEALDGAETCCSSEDYTCNLGSFAESSETRGFLLQANGSAYRALALEQTKGCVGIGISKAFCSAQECKGWHAVFLLSGGKFAACIFGASGCLMRHKVLKRYVVRGKQGGSQSSHDKKGGKAKSIGAQMRREGEKRLAEDVQDLLSSWCEELRSCRVILVSLPAQKKSLVFGDWLNPRDPRVRKIPFPGIGKPSLESCLQAHSLVCSTLFFRSWPRAVQVEAIPCLPARRQRGEREAGLAASGSPVSHSGAAPVGCIKGSESTSAAEGVLIGLATG